MLKTTNVWKCPAKFTQTGLTLPPALSTPHSKSRGNLIPEHHAQTTQGFMPHLHMENKNIWHTISYINTKGMGKAFLTLSIEARPAIQENINTPRPAVWISAAVQILKHIKSSLSAKYILLQYSRLQASFGTYANTQKYRHGKPPRAMWYKMPMCWYTMRLSIDPSILHIINTYFPSTNIRLCQVHRQTWDIHTTEAFKTRLYMKS